MEKSGRIRALSVLSRTGLEELLRLRRERSSALNAWEAGSLSSLL